MKIFFVIFILGMSTASCSNRAKHAVYDMLHEKQRQECLMQGRQDCPRTENYDDYSRQRQEVMNNTDDNK